MDWYIPETLRNLKDQAAFDFAKDYYSKLRNKGMDPVEAIKLTNAALTNYSYSTLRWTKQEIEAKELQEKEARELAKKLSTPVITPTVSNKDSEPTQPSLGLGYLWDK